MQTTAIRTVAYSLPENEAILLTLLISNRYILFAELANIFLSPYFFCRQTAEFVLPVFVFMSGTGCR